MANIEYKFSHKSPLEISKSVYKMYKDGEECICDEYVYEAVCDGEVIESCTDLPTLIKSLMMYED